MSENTLKIHYYFKDPNAHQMDVYVRRKCEKMILHMIEHTAELLNIKDLQIDTEAYKEGGLKEKLVIALITGGTISGIISPAITGIFQHFSSKKSPQEIKAIMIQNIQNAATTYRELGTLIPERQKALSEQLDSTMGIYIPKIQKNTSDFFKTAQDYNPITRIDINDYPIERSEFQNYILETDDLNPLSIENVEIEIISPVLKKDNNEKWSGYWLKAEKKEKIFFTITNEDFLEKIYNYQEKITPTTLLSGILIIQRKLSDNGDIKVSSYNLDGEIGITEKDTSNIPTATRKYPSKKKQNQNQENYLFDPSPYFSTK